ncbi:MAG: hypothetical protein ABSG15_05725, partial [FCB group bacterium]
MKIKKRLLFAFILTGLIIFISCSSNNNPTTPNNNNKVNFSSLAYLNYWINNNYNIDTLGQQTGTITVDSTVVTDSTIKAGHKAYVLTVYNMNKMPTDTQYVYEDSVRYYTHSHFFNSIVAKKLAGYPNPFDIGDRWIKLADYDSTSWNIFSDSL